MHSFREEIERLTALHFAPERIKTKTRSWHATWSACSAMRLATRDASCAGSPRGSRRLPGLEALGARLSRNITRLASAISFAALVIGGSMLLLTRWRLASPAGRKHDLGRRGRHACWWHSRAAPAPGPRPALRWSRRVRCRESLFARTQLTTRIEAPDFNRVGGDAIGACPSEGSLRQINDWEKFQAILPAS